MEKELSELWKERKSNQRYPLIGSIIPGEGNGYHDRISKDIPYQYIKDERYKRSTHWLYTVYFRDLSNSSNPNYKSFADEFEKSLILKNCSANYQETLYKYLFKSDRWHRNRFCEIIGDWVRELIFNGAVIKEFVSWMDNNSNNFYGFQLSRIDTDYCKIKSKKIVYNAPIINEVSQIELHKHDIPRDKLIIILWPNTLGGYEFYKSRVEEIMKINSPFNSDTNQFNGTQMLNAQKKWEFDFAKKVSPWGTNHPLKDTSIFYKNYSYFMFRRTAIYCVNEVIQGLTALVNLLNMKLNENATLEFNFEQYNIQKFEEVFQNWKNGKMTIDEFNQYLHH